MIDRALAFPLVLGLLGACIGSFLNVVIYRLPKDDLSITRPRRSFCPKCQRPIPFRENVPIVSYLLLGGRCKGCKGEIALRYLVVELLTTFLFASWGHLFLARDGEAAAWEQGVVLLSGLLLIGACLVVTFIDIDERIIPDQITKPGMAIGLACSLVAPLLQSPSWLDRQLANVLGVERHLAAGASSLAGLLTGAITVWLVGVGGRLAFRPKDEEGNPTDAMGFGDVKYMGMVGAFVGFDGVLLVFLVACISGAVGGLVYRLITRDRYIPFGPYLSLGVLLVWFFRTPLFRLLLEEWPRFVQGLVSHR